MPDRTPILKIEMFVDEHETKEPSDTNKPDSFVVRLKSYDKEFKVGLQDAKAKLSIKAFDDIIKANLPKKHSFVIEVYAKERIAVVKDKTAPTTLTET